MRTNGGSTILFIHLLLYAIYAHNRYMLQVSESLVDVWINWPVCKSMVEFFKFINQLLQAVFLCVLAFLLRKKYIITLITKDRKEILSYLILYLLFHPSIYAFARASSLKVSSTIFPFTFVSETILSFSIVN